MQNKNEQTNQRKPWGEGTMFGEQMDASMKIIEGNKRAT